MLYEVKTDGCEDTYITDDYTLANDICVLRNHGEDIEILYDVHGGKERPWKEFKLRNLELCLSYSRLTDRRSKVYKNLGIKVNRTYQCGSYLEFKKYDGVPGMKLSGAYFCSVRLCPMCSWRRSLKIYAQVSKVMNALESEKDYRYLFVTLTVKNCAGRDLSKTITDLLAGFNRLMARMKYKDTPFKGWFRALEVTHNWERNDYHPHIHMIWVVNKSYFKDSKVYVSQKKLTEMWQKSMKINYTPRVDMRVVSSSKKTEGCGEKYLKIVAEVAKYTAKSKDYLYRYAEKTKKDSRGRPKKKSEEEINRLTDEAVATLDQALHRRRLVAYGGIWKELHKKLNLKDAEEDDDLINVEEDEKMRDDLAYVLMRYSWNSAIINYYKSFEVTSAEIKDF